MNIGVNEVWKVSEKAFEKYAQTYSTELQIFTHIFSPILLQIWMLIRHRWYLHFIHVANHSPSKRLKMVINNDSVSCGGRVCFACFWVSFYSRGTITPWRLVLLEKLTITHLVKKFPGFYESRSFINVCTKAPNWTLCRVNQSILHTHTLNKIHCSATYSVGLQAGRSGF